MVVLVRRILKIIFFIVLSIAIGRSFDIYSLVSVDSAIRLSYQLFGEGGQENVEAVYSLIDIVIIIILTTIAYMLVMKGIRYFKK
ncbi:hypothetical protein HQN64_13070 [Enterobacteriaceae bacterium BIT-l23]|uniref:hypothetical protein n=1 Tax=Jejubacter sp. L23 TaxID=3092086 RepID=UPI0015851624|nr:hypothetical protein [Enterobacteriaceae bacterium BIT-l23]